MQSKAVEQGSQQAEGSTGSTATRSNAIQPPSVHLPKGGGAIQGIGEKFAANPVTGTGSMTVPIATSPGRSGFGPQLSLSYDSGAGNGPFGFGWSLSIPSITRKTDKGLPRYADGQGETGQDSDVFVLSGAEDLVPVLRESTGGTRIHDEVVEGYRVRRYRPRIEGLFARIERWTSTADATDVHWRSYSKDNILTLYGRSAESRIADPDNRGRIFSWLICETRDDKGNAIVYRYRKEDGRNIDLNLLSEAHRGPADAPARCANRYLERIHYGNRRPLLVDGQRPWDLPAFDAKDWLFEVVFDYGDHPGEAPTPTPTTDWARRIDPISNYRAGFEVRTARRCERVLMFHHFADEPAVGTNCLVRSTDFLYSDEVGPPDPRHPVYTFLKSVTQTGYRRLNGATEGAARYLSRSLPPVDFSYTPARLQHERHDLPAASLAQLPIGVDENSYRWVDLHGEGIPGILTEQAGAWFYKPNLTPRDSGAPPCFGATRVVASRPNAALSAGAQFIDLAGDGQLDLVNFDGPAPGFYEHDAAEGWQPHRPFSSRLNRSMQDPNLRMLDLTGDGHSDVLVSEGDSLLMHPSLGEAGFGPGLRCPQPDDDLPLVFAEAVQTTFLADMTGDGLTDRVRILNGEVSYWPNLGYGRFGPRVRMDHAPVFDEPGEFDPRRLRLADIDGSGTTDLIYLHRSGVRIWFNQCGNSWSAMQPLQVDFPTLADPAHLQVADLFGNGTACLLWSSPLPAHAQGRQMSYVQLIGDDKPHLLVGSCNNLGAETLVRYAPSTHFYLQDKAAGQPWATRLPFPVHVVQSVETRDHIGRNRFVTTYAYHHGHFDGEEREFRGFARVDQWDGADMAALRPGAPSGTTQAPAPDEWANEAPAFNLPRVRTTSWYHTGAWLEGEALSRHLQREYYRPGGQSLSDAAAFLLDDTVLPDGLQPEELREACRALKGSLLRQEVYAEDGSEQAAHPYTVLEQNFTLRCLQRRQEQNRHAVFFTHAREALTFHFERNPTDPRIQHALTLEVDDYGNVQRALAIGYGRRTAPGLPTPEDNRRQTRSLVSYTQSRYAGDAPTGRAIDTPLAWRTPLPAEVTTWELNGVLPPVSQPFAPWSHWTQDGFRVIEAAQHIAYETEVDESTAPPPQRRLIEHVRTLYRSDDLQRLLPLGELQPRALPGESYQLAFTRSLLDAVYRRDGQALLPDPNSVLGSPGADGGGYVTLNDLPDAWWQPSGRIHYHPDPVDAADELAEAVGHFFLPRRYRDAFGQDSVIDFDAHNLLMVETHDALGNRVTVDANDYRVLQPRLVSDPNRNRTEVAFDTLGMVAGTAVMGKPAPAVVEGDTLAGFEPDLTQAQLDALMAAPRQPSTDDPQASEATPIVHDLLQGATTRIVYDLDRYQRLGEPPFAATIARETHVSDLPKDAQGKPTQESKLQLSFSYSDGFGREIQKKIQAEPGRLDPDDPQSPHVNPRWVGSGWTIFNNKGKPVRKYEPFFSDTHHFEFDVRIGVSPVLFYDPAERVIATLHPNHTYEKVVFDPWQQTTYDVNDTVADYDLGTGTATVRDPSTDTDVGGFFARLPASDYLPTWSELRTTAALALAAWPDTDAAGTPLPYNATRRKYEREAAAKAAAHANTPTAAHFDALGRPFLTVAHNRVICADHDLNGREDNVATRVELDIEGNQRSVRDAITHTEARDAAGNTVSVDDPLGRVVMRYAYDMLGNRIRQISMEAGTRWMLNDVAGKPIRAWDSRGHNFATKYDALRRPVEQHVRGTFSDADPLKPNSDPRTLNRDILVDKIEYGESLANAEALNLRTRIYRHCDSAGVATNAGLDAAGNPTQAYDFKGNLLRSTRQLVSDYTAIPDWQLVPKLDNEFFEGSTRYDALNRPIQSVAPRSSLERGKFNVIQPVFNEANLLDRVDVWLDRAASPGALLDPAADAASAVGVANIDYDAKGQRERVDYKNGASTFYRYDPLNFRLIHLLTRRKAADFPGDDPQPPLDPAWPGKQVQNLHYTYDPAGNITHIQDDAQQTIYFRNQRVEPSNDYVYDALYRLIQATGREHLGQAGSAPMPHSHDDAGRVGLLHPGDGNAMGRYIERYVYDAVGNFLQMQHRGSDPAHSGWTRGYTYLEPSLTEDGNGGAPLKPSNRLTRTTLNPAGNTPQPETYQHDAHGNMLRMPHLGGGLAGPNMHWDYKDQLRQIDRGAGSSAFYVYDASGKRVRKVWEKALGLTEERIYLGGFEIFRSHDGPIGTDTTTLERETLHVMDDKQRIALVETRTLDTAGDEPAPRQLIRYQFGNHLGSACLELDEQVQIISYEEYAPNGSSTYQAVRSQTETAKQYRFTEQERDDETGFSYHRARYYVSWLARWISKDPAGLKDGTNGYSYVRNNPSRLIDPSGQTGNDPEDVLKHIYYQAGFEQGQSTPQTSAQGQAVWGQRAHLRAESVHRDLVKAGVKDADRIVMAPAINKTTGVLTKVGGNPIRGHDNPDALVFPKNQVPGTGSVIAPGQAQTSADFKYGRGEITTRQASYAQQGITINAAYEGGSSPAQTTPVTSTPPAAGTVNLSSKDADVDQATGRVVAGPNTTAAQERRAQAVAASGKPPTPPAASPATQTKSTASASASPRINTAGNGAGTLVKGVVPGVAEAEVGLVGAAYYASQSAATAPLVTPLLTVAEAAPIVGGGLVAGGVAGNLYENAATSLGASETTAKGSGIGGAILTGAAVGALIGSPTGIGAPIGAVIGGAAGLIGYGLSKWL